jgi:hypothetical protein
MDPARWQIVKDVFHAALLQDATERTAYLQRVVADDASLRAEIAAMIAAEEKGGTSIESRIAEVASELLEDDPARSPAGSQVGNHRILSALGAGGMGEVYLAEDTRLGRKVALKDGLDLGSLSTVSIAVSRCARALRAQDMRSHWFGGGGAGLPVAGEGAPNSSTRYPSPPSC